MMHWRDRFGARLVPAIAVLYGICFVVWRLLVASPLMIRWWPLQVSEIFAVWALAPVPFLLVAGLVWRSRWLWLSLLVPLIWFGSEYGSLFLPSYPPAARASVEGKMLRVMTLNTWHESDSDGEFAEFVKQQQPDLIALQEVGSYFNLELKDLSDEWPYQMHTMAGPHDNIVLLSKFPIVSEESDREWRGCFCAQAVIDWHGRAVRIVVVHIWSPYYDVDTNGLVPQVTDFTAAHQKVTYDALLMRMQASREPLIVLGDFNTTERQPGYAQLYAVGLEDAHAAVGWGLGHTYPAPYSEFAWLPVSLIRIDHIFYDLSWRAKDVWTQPLMGSDHQSVIADLQFVVGK
jgi:vancomycin resistance protein VanJ